MPATFTNKDRSLAPGCAESGIVDGLVGMMERLR
jgi:hypothetical protein